MKNFQKAKSKKLKTRLPAGRQGGQAMLISVIFFLFISLAIISGLVTPSVREFKIANDLIRSRQSFFLSESGIEDAYFRLKNAKPIGASTVISLNGTTAETAIIDSGSGEKTISSLGDFINRQRKNELKLFAGTGVSFNYGILADKGGFTMGNTIVIGNVHSNEDITPTIGTQGKIEGVASAIGRIDVVDVTGAKIEGADYVPMPITEEMITQWKTDAEAGGVIAGGLAITEANTHLGPKKIDGDLAINANLTITGTIWVTGKITTKNGAEIKLDPSYGPSGGIIMADGTIHIDNNATFAGSGSSGSYVLLLSTSSCKYKECVSKPEKLSAINIDNNAGSVIVNAQKGDIHFSENGVVNGAVGYSIHMDNNSTIDYLPGLADATFSSGSNAWNIKSWKEVR